MLKDNPAKRRTSVPFATLSRFSDQIVWRALELDREMELSGTNGAASGLFVTPFYAPGKRPIHLSHLEPSAEDNVGLSFTAHRGGRAVYVTAVAALDPVKREIANCDVLLCDGTFWTDEELSRLGPYRRARDMGHVPIFGPGGSLRAFSETSLKRKIYTHVNNTNPISDAVSEQRRLLASAGWEVASDGMEVHL